MTSAIEGAGLLSARAPRLARLAQMIGTGINFVATNVPGSPVPVYLAGHRMAETVGMIPLTATLGYGVAILSYNRNLYLGLMAEPNLMPDVGFMKSRITETLHELIAAVPKEMTRRGRLATSPESWTSSASVASARDLIRIRFHPAFEDDDRRQRVESGLARALARRHVRQALARFETRQPLVEHLDVDRERFAQTRREFPRRPGGGAFAAIHVEPAADHDQR